MILIDNIHIPTYMYYVQKWAQNWILIYFNRFLRVTQEYLAYIAQGPALWWVETQDPTHKYI